MPKKKEAKPLFCEHVLRSHIDWLQQSNKQLHKTVYLNNTISDTLLEKVDWDKEFGLFFSFLPSEEEILGFRVKKIKETDIVGSTIFRKKNIYTLQKKSTTHIIETQFIGDSLTSLRIEFVESNQLSKQNIRLFYQSYQSLGLKNNSKIKGQEPIELESQSRIL